MLGVDYKSIVCDMPRLISKRWSRSRAHGALLSRGLGPGFGACHINGGPSFTHCPTSVSEVSVKHICLSKHR